MFFMEFVFQISKNENTNLSCHEYYISFYLYYYSVVTLSTSSHYNLNCESRNVTLNTKLFRLVAEKRHTFKLNTYAA